MSAKSSRLPLVLSLGFVVLLLLVVLMHVASGVATRYFVEKLLHPAAAQGTYVGETHLNLLTGLFRVDRFELEVDGRRRIAFGTLEIDTDPRQLLSGNVRVEGLRLRDAFIRVERRQDGGFELGLPPIGGGNETPASDPWGFRLDGIVVDGLVIAYADGDLESELDVRRLEVGSYLRDRKTQTIPVSWDMLWDGQRLAGQADVVIDDNLPTEVNGTLSTDPLDLEKAQRLARTEPLALGAVAYDGRYRWAAAALAFAGRLGAGTLDVRSGDQTVGVKGLDLSGFALDLSLQDPPSAELRLGDGLALGSLVWQSGEQAMQAKDMTLTGQVAAHLGQRLPSLQLKARAGGLDFSDSTADFAISYQGLQVEDLGLTPLADTPGARVLQARFELGRNRIRSGEHRIDIARQRFSLQGQLTADGPPRIEAGGTLSALSLQSPALPARALSVSSVEVGRLRVDHALQFEALSLRGIELPARNPDLALRLAALTIDRGRHAEDAGAELGKITLDGLQTAVIRDQAGAWRHVMSGPDAGDADTSAAAPAETAGSSPSSWSFDGVEVTGDSHISAADHLNPDSTAARFSIERLTIGALSSRAPAQDTAFAATLRPDQYAEFVIDGTVRPLAGELGLSAQGHLHGFGLKSVNGFVADDLGHRFLDGQLDNDFSISIEQNRLEMSNGLHLAGVSVEEIEGKEGPPLATAIALLEDRDGNIKLEVPVSGDLTNPDFRVLGALNPIIMKAVAGTAALAIQPLGSVLLVGGLLANQALKVTFEPALFDAGDSELDAASRKYLRELAAKLKEKPKLALKVCGVAVDADRKKDKKGAYVDTEEAALEMADRRAQAARAYLRDEGVRKKQLRICRPALDSKPDAPPRVDIRL